MTRFFAALVLLYAVGFLWFAAFLPQPLDQQRADAVIVPTGGPGRIERGLATVREGQAKEMFVSGVARQVTPGEFAAEYDIAPATMTCCVTLGYAAVDTRSNAKEAAEWVAARKHQAIRLVTTDWHMRRTLSEFRDTMPPGVRIWPDAVPSSPSLPTLFAEYNKHLASLVWRSLPL